MIATKGLKTMFETRLKSWPRAESCQAFHTFIFVCPFMAWNAISALFAWLGLKRIYPNSAASCILVSCYTTTVVTKNTQNNNLFPTWFVKHDFILQGLFLFQQTNFVNTVRSSTHFNAKQANLEQNFSQ